MKKYVFPCRGCNFKGREIKWNNFVSSISDETNRAIDNSYLDFEEEPNNPADPYAIKIIVRGEFFGTLGYVGREYTGEIRSILKKCKWHHLDMEDEDEAGSGTISLILSWSPKGKPKNWKPKKLQKRPEKEGVKLESFLLPEKTMEKIRAIAKDHKVSVDDVIIKLVDDCNSRASRRKEDRLRA